MIDLNVDFMKQVLQYLAFVSIFTFVLSCVCIPWIIARLPEDFFLQSKLLQKRRVIRPPLSRLPLLVIRNSLGLLLLVAGVAMLFLPGQGLITILLGFTLMSFPYKRRFVFNITRQRTVQNSLNWIRKKTSRQPFNW